MLRVLVPRTAHRIPSPDLGLNHAHPLRSNLNKSIRFFQWKVYRVSLGEGKQSASISLKSKNSDSEVTHAGNLDGCSTNPDGTRRVDVKETVKGFSFKELMQGLKRYGVAGVLSYGLLNTIYYLTTYLLVWFYFAPAPGRMGYAAAVERFLKVMAMVWAGSQVTKIVRAGGALALAPFVDKGLSWFTVKFKFESKGKASAAIAGMCFGLALLLFFGLTLLWA